MIAGSPLGRAVPALRKVRDGGRESVLLISIETGVARVNARTIGADTDIVHPTTEPTPVAI